MPVLILILVLFVMPIYAIYRLSNKKVNDTQSFERQNLPQLLHYQFKSQELNDEINSTKTDIARKVECAHECVSLYRELWDFCSKTDVGQSWYYSVISEPRHQAETALEDFSALLDELDEFHRNFFPLVSPDEKIQSDWEIIPCDHNAYEQLVRQKRSIDTVPIYIDHETLKSLFFSSHSDAVYVVQLFSCSCPDFQFRNLPCKHMYRLFYELTVGTDPLFCVVAPDAFNSCIYKLSDLARAELINLVYSLNYYSDGTTTVIKTKQVSQFIDLGLIWQLDDIDDVNYILLLNEMTKNDILTSLRGYGIVDFFPSWPKKKLVDWVITNHREYLKKKFSHYVAIAIPPELSNLYSSMVNAIDSQRTVNAERLKSWNAEFDKFL